VTANRRMYATGGGRSVADRNRPRNRLYPNTDALRQYIRKRMDELEIPTPWALAQRTTGISHQTVNSLMNRRGAGVQLSTLEAVAEALKVDLSRLLELTDVARPWVWSSRFDEVPEHLRIPTENFIGAIFEHLGIVRPKS
jgi:DNA-binding Xre family transcriptional regulator